MLSLLLLEEAQILETGSQILIQSRLLTLYVQTARFIKDFTQPILTLPQQLELKLNNFSHCIDQPQFMLLAIA